MKLFTLRECGKGPVVLGLERIPANHANLRMLAYDKALDTLDVGEHTFGRNRGQVFEVVRVE